MLWSEIVPQLRHDLCSPPRPDALIIHLGSNDLVRQKSIELLHTVTNDIETIQALLPNCTLMWSHLLPRLYWQGVSDIPGMERARKKVNRKASVSCVSLGGKQIKHVMICHKVSWLLLAGWSSPVRHRK